MIIYVIYGILGFAWLSCFAVGVMQARKLTKLQKYTHVKATISRTVHESWSGDTADRDGGAYDFPVAEFWVEPHGNVAFVLREAEHMHYKPGETVPMAYPPHDPPQAVVVDARKAWLTLALYCIFWLVLTGLLLVLCNWTGSVPD